MQYIWKMHFPLSGQSFSRTWQGQKKRTEIEICDFNHDRRVGVILMAQNISIAVKLEEKLEET